MNLDNRKNNLLQTFTETELLGTTTINGHTSITGHTSIDGNVTIDNGDNGSLRIRRNSNEILTLLGDEELYINMKGRSIIALNGSDSEIKLGNETLTEEKLNFLNNLFNSTFNKK